MDIEEFEYSMVTKIEKKELNEFLNKNSCAEVSAFINKNWIEPTDVKMKIDNCGTFFYDIDNGPDFVCSQPYTGEVCEIVVSAILDYIIEEIDKIVECEKLPENYDGSGFFYLNSDKLIEE